MFKRFFELFGIVATLTVVVALFCGGGGYMLVGGRGGFSGGAALGVILILFVLVPLWVVRLQKLIAGSEGILQHMTKTLDQQLEESGKQGDWIRTVLSQDALDQVLTGMANKCVESRRHAVSLTRGVWVSPAVSSDGNDALSAFRKELEGRIRALEAAKVVFEKTRERAMQNGYSIRPLEDYLPEEDRPGVPQRV